MPYLLVYSFCLFLSVCLFVCYEYSTQWKKCSFSGDAQYIVAGSYRQHELYIWDKATGSLVKMLTGQKGETLLDIAVRGMHVFVCVC